MLQVICFYILLSVVCRSYWQARIQCFSTANKYGQKSV